MNRNPPREIKGFCRWCGEPLNKRQRTACRGHWIKWFNFWYTWLPGYVIVVFARDLFRCRLCGYEADWSGGWSQVRQQLHVDHIKPVSLGGLHCLDNMRTLCRRCNIGRGNRDETWEPVQVRRDKAKLAVWKQPP